MFQMFQDFHGDDGCEMVWPLGCRDDGVPVAEAGAGTMSLSIVDAATTDARVATFLPATAGCRTEFDMYPLHSMGATSSEDSHARVVKHVNEGITAMQLTEQSTPTFEVE